MTTFLTAVYCTWPWGRLATCSRPSENLLRQSYTLVTNLRRISAGFTFYFTRNFMIQSSSTLGVTKSDSILYWFWWEDAKGITVCVTESSVATIYHEGYFVILVQTLTKNVSTGLTFNRPLIRSLFKLLTGDRHYSPEDRYRHCIVYVKFRVLDVSFSLCFLLELFYFTFSLPTFKSLYLMTF